MKFHSRSSPLRLHPFVPAVGVVAVSIVLTMSSSVIGIAAGATGGAVPHLGTRVSAAPCTSQTVRETTSTNENSYGPGAVVTMISSLDNTSAQACTVAVGPTSPSLTVTNASGVEVWSSCGGAGETRPCALYLIQETLQPGDTYARSATWDQRSGDPTARVPTGKYVLTTNFLGVSGQSSTTFTLTASAPPHVLHVTLADSGRKYSMARGSKLSVQLSGSTIYTWSVPVSSSPAVLKRPAGSSGDTALATFVAQAKGDARVTAVGNPKCYPQCLMPSRLFSFTVSVVE